MNKTVKIFAVLALILSIVIAYGADRASQWAKYEKQHRLIEAECQWDGKETKDVQVHHILKFSKYPQYELVDTPDGKHGNMITLCTKHADHIFIGHDDDYKDENPFVREECDFHRANMKKYKEKEAELSKQFDAIIARQNK